MSPRDSTPAKRDHRQEVTDSIIKMLEEGVAPWQKPWESLGMPANPATGNAYRGGNAIHLIAAGLSRGYEDPRWMTYKQAADNGWQVRKGEKGTHIEFWDVRNKAADKNTTGDRSGAEQSVNADDRRFIHRVYTVFNAKQIDGVPALEQQGRSTFDAVQSGERVLNDSRAKIVHDQRDHAFYNRSSDSIHLPPRAAFNDAPGFYGTALHELAHWSGHPSRLNRSTLNESYQFGDLNYAKEELRAELASLFIAAEVGVPHDPANHAAYVGSWVKALKEDKNEIFRAAHDASRAADFLLTLERERSKAESLEIDAPSGNVSGQIQGIRDETERLEVDHDVANAREREFFGVKPGEASKEGGEREGSRFVARFENQTATVAVHDKRSGADHHIPVDSVANGQREGDAARTPTEEALSASLANTKEITTQRLGSAAKTRAAQTQSGNYRGEIIGESDLHIIQRISSQTAVAHQKDRLEQVPQVGANVAISYANDLGSAREIRQRTRSKELSR